MTGSREPSPQVVWMNGRFVTLDRAAVSPLDRGFLYGDGVFETMRAQDGVVLYLEEHIERAARSLVLLRINAEFPSGMDDLLGELLRHNELTRAAAVIKILVTRGVGGGLGLPSPSDPTVLVTAHRYIPPDPATYEKGWKLIVFQEGFSPPLAAHKTLNYLYFLVARQAALDADADEALIRDPQGRITETSAGSLIVRSHGAWWTPSSSYQLPGITIHRVARIFHHLGLEVDRRSATPQELTAAETIWVVNSLMGIMPVSWVDGIPVPEPAPEEAAFLRNLLFDQGKQRKADRSP